MTEKQVVEKTKSEEVNNCNGTCGKDAHKEPGIANLAQALSKFQGEVRNAKNSAENPFFKSNYAPLEEVLETVRPVLGKYGLSIVQIPITNGAHAGVKTILMHESGEKIEAPTLFLINEKGNAQGAGSAITYARRYALSSMLGVASEDDDDANSISPMGESTFDVLMKDGQTLGRKYYDKSKIDQFNAVVEKHFGKGKKIADAKPTQVDKLRLAIQELEKNL